MDEPILMKLYTVVVHNLKKDVCAWRKIILVQKNTKGDNSREINMCILCDLTYSFRCIVWENTT